MASFYGYQLSGNNFHETLRGELYRSAQPTPADLEAYAHHYGIRSVINLRGENTGHVWYDDEKRFTDSHHITLINFPISAKHELTEAQATELLTLMRDAPKPVLIHCKQGADRTGLAAALYLAGITKTGEFTAEWQLSPIYGHIPWISAARAMDATFEKLEPMLGYPDS